MDLECLHALNIDTVRWTHWIETWGPDSMKAGLRVVQSLLGDDDPSAWRDALFASWEKPEMTTSPASMGLDGLV